MRIENLDERNFYEKEAILSNWDVRTLKRQYNSSLFERIAMSREKERVLELANDGITLDLKGNIKNLLDEMKRSHVHILRTGELETLLLPFEVEYTHNKSRWIVTAINKIAELKKEEIENQELLYDFLSGIVDA